MADDFISLDQTNQLPEPTISLDTGIQTQELTPTVAATRAAKAQYGLGDTVSKSYDEFYQRFIAGQEPQVRQEAANANDLRRMNVLNNAIKNIAGKSGPLTLEEADHLKGMVQNWNPSNPDSVIEDAFSVKAVNNIFTVNGGLDPTEDRPYSWLEDAMREIPKQVQETVAKASSYTSKIEYAKTLRGNIETDLEHQSYLGWGVDQLKGLTQLYPEAKLRGNVPIDVWGGLGTSKEEQAKVLLRMPDAEYRAKLTNIVNALRKDNPTMAAAFLDGVIGQSAQSVTLDNFFTTLAIPDLFAGGKIAGKLLKGAVLFNETRVAAKTMVQGLQQAADKQPIKAAVADAAGDLAEAAIQKEAVAIPAAVAGKTDVAKEAVEALQSIMQSDVKNIEANPGRYGQEIVNRLRESYNNFQTNLFSTIERVAKVERITPALATEAGIKAIYEQVKDSYPGIRNAILNISPIYKNDLTNTYHADIIIGKPTGEYWLRKEQAIAYAEMHGLTPDLGQKGLGWYIKITKPVNETTDAVRDFLTITKNAQSPNSWLSAFAGILRTPEETLAREQLLNRKVATYAPSELIKVAKETARDIEKLGKWTLPGTAKRQRWQEWERAVNYAQDAIDPDFVGPLKPGQTGGQKGYFFKSPAELETFYQQNFQRLPLQQETEAYFAFKRLGEMDHVLRNISIYRNMSRVGAENHILRMIGVDGKTVINSGTFQGVIRKTFPTGEDSALFLGEKHGGEKIFSNGITGSKKEILEGLKSGKMVTIELYDPELRPLANLSPAVKNERIRYVIARSDQVETKSLDYVNLPYKGGGHFEYDYEHYIKQAKIRPERVGKSVRNWYEGDTTVMPVSIRGMGKDIVDKMNAVRELMVARKFGEAKDLAGRTLPFEWKEFQGWFKDKKLADGTVVAARLNAREPFVVVPKGRQIKDLDDALPSRYRTAKGVDTFKDGTSSGSLARQYQVQYTGQRDAYDMFTFRNEGTAHNPLYKIEDPKMIDPIPTMNRALSRITNSFFMDDYKISAIEHWLHEAQPFLKAEQSELRYAPFYHFNNISDNAWRKGAPPEMVKQLMTRYMQIKQFTGVASSTDALLHSFGQKLADSIYAKFGPEGLKLGGFAIEPAAALAHITDPVKLVRSLTFHAKLGLFSIPQFLVQSQTYTNIYGIAGFSKAAPGSFAALLHQYSRVNPSMIEALDKYASRFHIPGTSRWRPGEFKEAWTELKNTGFGNVAGEYALRDDLMSHKVVSTGRDKFLDAGAFFFKEGEKNVRLGAWYTAYREFRDKNPLGKLTDTDRRTILDRATLLNVNMDRSSNSILQHGAFSIPTQFLTYQIRAAELLLSKRLTGVERARLLAWNAGMYGVPTAVSAATIFPLGDNLRKAAIDNGYLVGENYLSTLMEGLPATLMAVATGGGDMTKGNWYNVGERYGPGFSVIRDALQGDRTLWDLAAGAAGSTLTNTWVQSDGLRTALTGFVRGDFKLKSEDVIDVFKEISSVNAAWKTWAGINSGRWLAKGEGYVTDTSAMNALFQGTSGLQEQKINDARTLLMLRKDEKALAEYSEKKFKEEFQRSLRSDNENEQKSFMERAFTWLKIGGYPENRYGQAISSAVQDNTSLVDRARFDWATKDVPATKRTFGITRDNIPQQRLDTLGRSVQQKGP